MAATTLDRTFSALGDPVRLEIVRRLASEPATVAQIAEPFDMSRPAISKHLRVLKGAGVVESRTEGRQNWYSVSDGAFDDAADWLADIQTMWSGALLALKSLVEEENNGNSD